MNDEPKTEPTQCLDDHTGTSCIGIIEYRMALTDTGRNYPRCDHHWTLAVKRHQAINERYPIHPPTDWSPLDAGEAWNETDY